MRQVLLRDISSSFLYFLLDTMITCSTWFYCAILLKVFLSKKQRILQKNYSVSFFLIMSWVKILLFFISNGLLWVRIILFPLRIVYYAQKYSYFILEISCLEGSKVKCVGRVIHKNSVSTGCETLFLLCWSSYLWKVFCNSGSNILTSIRYSRNSYFLFSNL